MNPLKKLYCRGFQAAFRLVMPLLPYREPEILSGVDAIPPQLKRLGLSKPLIVTGSHVYALGLTKPLENGLTNSHLSFSLFSGNKPNPTTAIVEDALAQYRQDGCDCLIAFGGGSPMDCAKATAARVACPQKALGQMAGLLKVRRRVPTLFAIPTTAGSGSEATLASVIVDSVTRHKYVINDFSLIPHYAVLDPRAIRTLPAATVAATGLDALTHAVEAYIGGSTTPKTRAWAEEAITLIFAHLPDAAAHTSPTAEAAMLRASHLAGRAFTRSYVGYVHALSHALSGRYDLPHGQTNAILLPIVLEQYGAKTAQKLNKLAPSGNFLCDLRALNRQLSIPETIPEIQPEDIPALAKTAAKEANPLYPVPVLFDAEQLEKIYFLAKSGR